MNKSVAKTGCSESRLDQNTPLNNQNSHLEDTNLSLAWGHLWGLNPKRGMRSQHLLSAPDHSQPIHTSSLTVSGASLIE